MLVHFIRGYRKVQEVDEDLAVGAISFSHMVSSPNFSPSSVCYAIILTETMTIPDTSKLILLSVLLLVFTTVSSFTIQPISTLKNQRISTTTNLGALPPPKPYDTTYKSKPPTFNKQTSLWEPSAETEPQPYGPWGSFLRGGPAPFLVRTLNANDYDQAVFKYMAQTSCSRIEAQGNMDAFFNNGADWAYQKSEEARLVCFVHII